MILPRVGEAGSPLRLDNGCCLLMKIILQASAGGPRPRGGSEGRLKIDLSAA